MTDRLQRSRQRGVAIVEFALVLPFLLMLTFITTEFGRALYEYGLLTESVRTATRYLTTVTPETMDDAAKNLAVYGTISPAAGDPPLARELTTGNVSTAWGEHTPPVGTRIVTVTISGYQFKPMVGSVFGLTFTTIEFPPISATMRVYL